MNISIQQSPSFIGLTTGAPATAPQTSTTSTHTDISSDQSTQRSLENRQTSSNSSLVVPQTDGTNPTETATNLSGFSETQVSADIFAFMALFQQLAQQMRDTARTQRTTDMQAQVTSLQNAAEKMKEAAGQRLTAAIVQGAMQIAGGLLQMGMSGASVSSSVKGAKLDNQAASMSPKAQVMTGIKIDAAKATATGQAQIQMAQATGGITGGLGGIIGATFQHKADMAEVDKTNLETQAKVAETGVQHANDMMQQMMEVIRDVRDKLASIQQASIETNRGIARNI